MAKRAIDLVGASIALLVLSPVVAVVAVAILVSSGRPILFRQRRPGLHGKPFTIVKFRTMRPPRSDEVASATDRQRATRVGRALRATSIDELPELLNVIRGDMSLVGPRPLLMEYLSIYTSHQARRHEVRPGLTSWAIVNGRHVLRFDERLELDVWYVDHRSMRLDLRIIAMTIAQLVHRSGVAATQDPQALGFPIVGGDLPAESTATSSGSDDRGRIDT